MRWYRRELGDSWRWRLHTVGIVAEGKKVGSIVEGTGQSDKLVLSFWNDGLASWPDEPYASKRTSFEVVVWRVVPGVSYD